MIATRTFFRSGPGLPRVNRPFRAARQGRQADDTIDLRGIDRAALFELVVQRDDGRLCATDRFRLSGNGDLVATTGQLDVESFLKPDEMPVVVPQQALEQDVVVEAMANGAVACGATAGGDGTGRVRCQQAEAVSRIRVPPRELVRRVVMATLTVEPIRWSGPSK